MNTSQPTSQPEDVKFTVGWVCALPVEMSAAKAMLDEKYDFPVPSRPGDTNIYTLGRIGGHQVVITSLPAGKPGVTAAAVVATRMLADSPDIRFGLMVGIASSTRGGPRTAR
ncbi:unnamed protein product [Aureobasidium mustum]|uniref:Nucleoside phosphorylase domain-containing protein n=1 Tax=Aureobasidium mustum TaxID=2773714 RepID=A0A9N8K0A0_9PEZI|nr:unnamed protein product [Aureobasidium mustum]